MGCSVIDDGRNVIEAKSIVTQKGKAKRVADDDVRRCTELAQGLADIIHRNEPSHAYLESPTGGSQDARAGRCMGMATGIAVAVLSLLNVPVTFVTPTDSKKACGGNKNSDKNFVKDVVKKVFNWKTKVFNEHVADSAAAVLVGLNREGFQLV